MTGRLIGMDNNPSARPVRFGETWRILMEKCVLEVAVAEANEVCGTK